MLVSSAVGGLKPGGVALSIGPLLGEAFLLSSNPLIRGVRAGKAIYKTRRIISYLAGEGVGLNPPFGYPDKPIGWFAPKASPSRARGSRERPSPQALGGGLGNSHERGSAALAAVVPPDTKRTPYPAPCASPSPGVLPIIPSHARSRLLVSCLTNVVVPNSIRWVR